MHHMVGAQHAAVIPVDVEALVDGDTRSVGLPTVPDHDIGTVASEDAAYQLATWLEQG